MRFTIATVAGLAAAANAAYAPEYTPEAPVYTPEAPAYYTPAAPAYTPAPVYKPEAPVYQSVYNNTPSYPTTYEAPSYTTEVVTDYTTYCPEPTVVTYGAKTYTVTEATTLTIKDCYCTVTKPVYTPVETAPVAPVYTPAPPATNATTYATPSKPAAYTGPVAPVYTGAASKVSFGAAGLLAVAGAVFAL